MRLDLTVNLLTMQALTKGAMTVLGGSQVRPNIHIDDLVDVYLFALDRRLAGVYNAGFENLSVLDIARAHRVARAGGGADPAVERSAVLPAVLGSARWRPASRHQNASRPPSTSSPALYAAGRLRDDPASHNVSWMKQHNLS